MDGATIEVGFTPGDVSTPTGLERWREIMGHAVLKLDLELLTDRPFASRVQARFLPGVSIARASKSGLRMVRSRAHPDENDNLSLHVATGGSWNLSHRGASSELRPGAAALVLNDEPATVECPTPTTAVCIQFPRRALDARVRCLPNRLLQPVGGEALQLLVDYVELLESRPSQRSVAVAHAASAHIMDLVALVVSPTADGWAVAESGGARAARFRRIKRYVHANAARSDLSVSHVASRHRVTPRYVQRLFEVEEGTTFSRYVLELRLTEAHRRLVEPAGAHRSIAAVAFDVGFADLSHFNRTFKHRFGARPSDVRAEAMRSRAREVRSHAVEPRGPRVEPPPPSSPPRTRP
ncbi:MAG: AraC family transcriptional regulator [Labilithrix sp.]|nr:AraC family transcriptional regulator [Labilithrix sp.]MCW5834888.1 AraC family transcriptional regulator [Labilithrix sp.]